MSSWRAPSSRVEHHDAWFAHQRAADRDHVLFTNAEGPGVSARAILQSTSPVASFARSVQPLTANDVTPEMIVKKRLSDTRGLRARATHRVRSFASVRNEPYGLAMFRKRTGSYLSRSIARIVGSVTTNREPPS